jgi:DNA-binding transcriptional MerR regulator
MPVYSPIDRVAQKLNVTVEKLRILQAFGWISVTEKNGTHFVREDHVYKAKFILHLQDVLKLTPEQISTVLLAQEPHYSLKDVPRVLAGTPANEQTSN